MKKKILIIIVLMLTIFVTKDIEAKENLKVKIGKSYSNKEEFVISSGKNIYIADGNYNKVLDLGVKNLTVKLDGGKIILKDKNRVFSKDFSQKGELLLGTDDFLKLKNEYRGHILFKVLDGKLLVINDISLEDYLKGVVPKELSPSYPEEALKAQAICSRSFALKNINKYIKKGYNLDDTTNCQVYYGKSAEDKRSNKAIEDTKGVVAYYDGAIADTIFGASSGGITSNASEVWGGKEVPYLISKEDPYSKKYTWDLSISKEEISKKLKNNYKNLGEIIDINITEKDSSGRAKKIYILGSSSSETVSANKFRQMLGNTKFKSTLFTLENNGDKFIINGLGYGHGVGMSQYGAVEMAKNDKTAEEIIMFYFPGVGIEKLN